MNGYNKTMPPDVIQAILDNMNDWVLVIDHKTHDWIYSNAAVKRILGYEVDEIVGQNTFNTKVIPEDSQKIIREALPRLERDGVLNGLEMDFMAKDGHRVTVNNSVSLMKDQEGNILYRIAIIRDISLIKKLLEDLKASIKG